MLLSELPLQCGIAQPKANGVPVGIVRQSVGAWSATCNAIQFCVPHAMQYILQYIHSQTTCHGTCMVIERDREGRLAAGTICNRRTQESWPPFEYIFFFAMFHWIVFLFFLLLRCYSELSLVYLHVSQMCLGGVLNISVMSETLQELHLSREEVRLATWLWSLLWFSMCSLCSDYHWNETLLLLGVCADDTEYSGFFRYSNKACITVSYGYY